MNLMLYARLIAVSAMLAVPGWTRADAVYYFSVNLDGSQVVPASASPGTGTGYLRYDDFSRLLFGEISFSDLSSYPVSAHIHGPATPGTVAPSLASLAIPPLPILLPGDPGPGGNGTAEVFMEILDDALESQLLSGLWYIDFDTELYLDGEIRGQVQAVPVPAAVWLFGSGLLGLMALARRRKG